MSDDQKQELSALQSTTPIENTASPDSPVSLQMEAAADVLRSFETTEAAATTPANALPNEEVSTAVGADSADNTARKQRGRPFEPGQSGNPHGRPRGSRNRTTLAVKALINGKAEEMAAKALELALNGDSGLLRSLLGTIVSPRRERTVEFELPTIKTAADALVASSAVLAACAEGTLTPGEAREVMGLISTHLTTIETAEFESKLDAVDERTRHDRKSHPTA
jgi:Family of unknown function (DUF5681)